MVNLPKMMTTMVSLDDELNAILIETDDEALRGTIVSLSLQISVSREAQSVELL